MGDFVQDGRGVVGRFVDGCFESMYVVYMGMAIGFYLLAAY